MQRIDPRDAYKYLFQSAPGREAGRCAAGMAGRSPIRPGFNPRPAVRPGDALGRPGGFPGFFEFQSAPGREAGRCDVC